MIGIVVFNAVMSVPGALVGSGIVPRSLVKAVLDRSHNTLGITSPPLEKVGTVALIWMASTIVIGDGALSMLVFLTTRLM